VKSGDTLERIASAQNVSTRQLMLWNKLRNSRIYAGQVLRILPEAQRVRLVNAPDDVPSGPAKKRNGRTIVYVVKQGDTIWGIARAYAVSANEIKAWNSLRRNTIYAGQELVIRVDALGSTPGRQ
jgi:LysM repeat protein